MKLIRALVKITETNVRIIEQRLGYTRDKGIKEVRKMVFDKGYDEKEARRQAEINGHVKNSVNLNLFEKIPPKGSDYDTLEIAEYRDTSVRLKLPEVITEELGETMALDIRVNQNGSIIVLLPVTDNGHVLLRRKNTTLLYSTRLASKLKDKGVKLPARYGVASDEKSYTDDKAQEHIRGWVCRKEG